MKKTILNPIHLLVLLVFLFIVIGSAAGREVQVISVTDTINPAVEEFIRGSIARAEKDGAECLVIQLDTPGGLLFSTQKIVRSILNSKVPVVVYVAPSGSWAASAGTFITLAGHIAAMAPSTNIGAAHPVSIGPGEKQKKDQKPDEDNPNSQDEERLDRIERKLDELAKSDDQEESKKNTSKKEKKDKRNTADADKEDEQVKNKELENGENEKEKEKPSSEQDIMGEKIMQNTTAWIRGIARHRGRNAEWAEKAVRESLSITETEALKKNVIDLIAADLDDLLEKIDGREVEVGKEKVKLHTKGATVNHFKMSLRQRILSVISNPNVYYFLLLLGPLGLVLELYNPGLILPGVVGGICLILALYGSQVLPVNYAAMLLILLAIILFIAEIKITSYGLLTVGGVISFVLGGLMLFKTESELPGMEFRVSYSSIAITAIGTLALIFLVLERVVRAQRSSSTTGKQGMIGATGVVKRAIDPLGTVFIHGELWNAVSDYPIAVGTEVEVIEVKGLTLKVKRCDFPNQSLSTSSSDQSSEKSE